eukprot:TRINITY_DN113_c0_g1_i1.p1 TRINITY_DN113_c0_g1~~TRINITY_DN113_c0_g1_i1.p1  ORF type:complete len:272 (+),score=34.67 TRINITY_DN113_c0_g1_i1:152-967(+)
MCPMEYAWEGGPFMHTKLRVQLGTLSQDVGATILALSGAFVWVRLFDELSRRDILEQKLSRKLVHISAGLLFLFTWPLFSDIPSARFFAAVPSLTNMLRLLSLGLGISKNEGVVKSVSREGNPRELLRGPLYYVMVLTFVTVVFWRQSPVGIIALGMMCAGDGIADIIGRRLGKEKLPYNRSKSWAGSFAMFFFGSLVSLGLVYIFCSLGYFSCNPVDTTWRVLAIALAATIVESLPITDKLDDNFTVPLTVVTLGALLFPGNMLGLNLSL